MASIGERLREARMRQRVDVSEVEDATKIRAKYLRALENEEFDLLPGPTYVKSFLRTYAEYLGLDARLLVEEFRVRYEPREEEETPQFAPQPPPGRDRPPRRPPGALATILGAVGALVLILLVIGLLSGGDGGGEPSREEEAGERGEGEPAERGRGRRRGRAASGPRTVRMRIVPREPTYLCVDRGPEREPLFEGSLTDPRTFRGRRLRINLGKPSATVQVNGRRVETGGGANPVGFAFTPRGSPRRLPLGERPCA
jgi:cytoskeleton protein RodZ